MDPEQVNPHTLLVTPKLKPQSTPSATGGTSPKLFPANLPALPGSFNEPATGDHADASNNQLEISLDAPSSPSKNAVFGEVLRHNIAELQKQDTLTAFDAFNVLTHSFHIASNSANNQPAGGAGGGGGIGTGTAAALTGRNDSLLLTTVLEAVADNLNTTVRRSVENLSEEIQRATSSNNNNFIDQNVHHGEAIEFAKTAVQDYGRLDPMELAMLQAEQTGSKTAQQQVSAAEILAIIQTLNEKEFALLSEATNKQLKPLEDHLMYNGSAWYLPQIADCKPDEPENSISFEDGGQITVALFGKKVVIPLISLILRLLLLVAAWFTLWNALPRSLMQPGGYVFDPVVCFLICNVIGGILGRVFGMPPLVFILGFSILWANVPEPKALTGGIVKEVRTIISRTGLTMILLRSGLAMSWNTIQPAAGTILSMSFIPILFEVLAHGFTATALGDYGEDKIWPFVQAVTACPAASAVVGATVLLMRTWGYGTTRGPGVILLPSVVLDMVLAVWGINFMVSLVLRDENANLGWIIAQGPLQIFLGPIVGVIIGIIWYQLLKVLFREARVLPHGKYSRAFLSRVAHTAAAVFIIFGLLLVFFGYEFSMAGGGAMACVFMAASAQYLMTQDDSPEHFKVVRVKMFSYLTTAWDLLVMPALFSVAASSITVKTMFASDFIGKALACLAAGFGARIIGCLICTWNYDMTLSERIITVIASCGRATVQVALGPLAVQAVSKLPGGGTPTQQKYAAMVYDTAILGVLIMTPISVVLLTRVAPKFWLTDAEHAKIAAEAEKEKQKENELKKDNAEEQNVVQVQETATEMTEPRNSSSNKK